MARQQRDSVKREYGLEASFVGDGCGFGGGSCFFDRERAHPNPSVDGGVRRDLVVGVVVSSCGKGSSEAVRFGRVVLVVVGGMRLYSAAIDPDTFGVIGLVIAQGA
jgi:hypothetical protein